MIDEAPLDAARILAASVLSWWDSHEHDTTAISVDGFTEDRSIYDDEPEFIQFAKMLYPDLILKEYGEPLISAPGRLAIVKWIAEEQTGNSSLTIAAVGLDLTDQYTEFDRPYDADDFGRCYLLLKRCPELREILPKVVEVCPSWGPLVAVWDELTEVYEINPPIIDDLISGFNEDCDKAGGLTFTELTPGTEYRYAAITQVDTEGNNSTPVMVDINYGRYYQREFIIMNDSMVTVETINLTGIALDWSVCQAAGIEFVRGHVIQGERGQAVAVPPTSPSTNWILGGQLIAEHHISLSPPEAKVHRNGGPKSGWGDSGFWTCTSWKLRKADGHRGWSYHETDPLIAAMRLIVDVVLGDEVQVPAELLESQ